MSLINEVDRWRADMTKWAAIDKQPPPTDEEVLRQFVYSAIGDFLDENLPAIEDIDNSGTHWADFEDAISDWVDTWSSTGKSRNVNVADKLRRIPIEAEDTVPA